MMAVKKRWPPASRQSAMARSIGTKEPSLRRPLDLASNIDGIPFAGPAVGGQEGVCCSPSSVARSASTRSGRRSRSGRSRRSSQPRG